MLDEKTHVRILVSSDISKIAFRLLYQIIRGKRRSFVPFQRPLAHLLRLRQLPLISVDNAEVVGGVERRRVIRS